MCDISVIIPNYNHGCFLPEVLDSYRGDYPFSIEIIVIDDASTDNSLSILEDLSNDMSALRVHRSIENRGVEFSLNKGIELAKGEWLFFRAADDLSPVGALDAWWRNTKKFPHEGLITGDLLYFEHDHLKGTFEKMGVSCDPVCVYAANFVEQYAGNIIHGASTFVRKDWVVEVGSFDLELKWHSDWYLFMKIGLERGFVYVPETLGAMRLNPRSYNSAGTFDLKKRDEVLKHLILRFDSNPEFKEALLKNRCLDFFGEPLKEAIEKYAVEPMSYMDISQGASCDIRNNRSETGIQFVLRKFLKEHYDIIELHGGPVFLFGSGGHSHQLIEVMSDLGMRAIDGVVDNLDSKESRSFEGIEIETPAVLKHKNNPLVILSSKSYEPLFADTMDKLASGILYLKIWSRS